MLSLASPELPLSAVRDEAGVVVRWDVSPRASSELSRAVALHEGRAPLWVHLPPRGVLEQRRALDEAVSSGKPVVLTVRGPIALAGSALETLHADVTKEQLEQALALVAGFRVRGLDVRLDDAWAFFTPWTTIAELRETSDTLRRLSLADVVGARITSRLALAARSPLHDRARAESLVLGEPDANGDVPWRFADETTQSAYLALQAALSRDARGDGDAVVGASLSRLDDVLDAIAGVARGGRKRHLRLAAAPRDASHRAREHYVDLGAAVQRPPRVAAANAIRKTRAALAEGATRLVLGGRGALGAWFLTELATLARDLGAKELVVDGELDGTAARVEPRELAGAGIGGVRLRVTAAFGDAEQQLVERFRAAGLSVDLLVVPGEGTSPGVSDLVPRASAASVSTLWLGAADREPVGAVVAAIERLAKEALGSGLAVRLLPGAELPPCVFAEPAALAPALHVGEAIVERDHAAYARAAACDDCAARHACPGPLRARGALVPLLRPLGEDEAARTVPAPREQARVLREMESIFFVDQGERALQRRVLRINFHCNQACDFCFVSRELPQPDEDRLLSRIEDAARAGAALALSGGEPTLNPRLFAYVRAALEAGVTDLEIQTNAIKMADRAYARALAQTGLPRAFVSLHGVTADVSDRVTAAPGTWVRTVQGIKNLLAEGVAVRLSFVMCGANVAEFARFPAFVDEELRVPGGPALDLVLSFVAASTDNVPRDVRLIPRFTDVAASLREGVRSARERGLALSGLDSKCGVPACFLPDEVRDPFFGRPLPDVEVERHGSAFVKSPACARCALDRSCYGVRSSYAAMHGTDELVPL